MSKQDDLTIDQAIEVLEEIKEHSVKSIEDVSEALKNTKGDKGGKVSRKEIVNLLKLSTICKSDNELGLFNIVRPHLA